MVCRYQNNVISFLHYRCKWAQQTCHLLLPPPPTTLSSDFGGPSSTGRDSWVWWILFSMCSLIYFSCRAERQAWPDKHPPAPQVKLIGRRPAGASPAHHWVWTLNQCWPVLGFCLIPDLNPGLRIELDKSIWTWTQLTTRPSSSTWTSTKP